MKPPFEITENMLNLVAVITEKLTNLKYSLMEKKDLHLRKISKLKSVNSSCAIEANTLTLKEVEAVVNGKRIIAPPNEIIEVKNAYQAYSNIRLYNQYEVKSLLKAHKYLTENLKQDAGKFRNGDVAVYSNGVPIHYGARPEYVPNLVEDLFKWAEQSELSPLIKACIVHFEIEVIHPFSDGNGRSGRLWQSVILYNYNKIFELIPVETLIFENQQEYYEAIGISQKENSSTKFVEFMLDMISKSIDSLNLISEREIKKEYLIGLTKSQKMILFEITNNFNIDVEITMEDLITTLNKSDSNIRKYLQIFIEKNLISASGERKARRYRIIKDIFES